MRKKSRKYRSKKRNKKKAKDGTIYEMDSAPARDRAHGLVITDLVNALVKLSALMVVIKPLRIVGETKRGRQEWMTCKKMELVRSKGMRL